MSGAGDDPDEYTSGNQPDGSYYNPLPDTGQPGLLGAQYAQMMANIPGLTSIDRAALGINPDFSGDGTGLPPSVTITPYLSPPTSLASDSSAGNVDIDKLVTAMDRNALPKSMGICATNSRLGLEAAGLDTTGHPVDAKDYGPFLVGRGATVVSSDNYAPQAGDVAVFDGTDQHKYGHIQVFDGSQWVSDFKQRDYSPYRDKSSTPPSTVYRFPRN